MSFCHVGLSSRAAALSHEEQRQFITLPADSVFFWWFLPSTECWIDWRTGQLKEISAQLRGHKAISCNKGPARLPQRLQQESNVGNQSQEGSKDEIRRKIDENRPFADLEKLVFGLAT